MSSLARIRNSGSLLQSNICNLFLLGIQYAQSPALGVGASRHPRLETEPRDLAAVRSYYRSVRKVSKLRVVPIFPQG